MRGRARKGTLAFYSLQETLEGPRKHVPCNQGSLYAMFLTGWTLSDQPNGFHSDVFCDQVSLVTRYCSQSCVLSDWATSHLATVLEGDGSVNGTDSSITEEEDMLRLKLSLKGLVKDLNAVHRLTLFRWLGHCIVLLGSRSRALQVRCKVV